MNAARDGRPMPADSGAMTLIEEALDGIKAIHKSLNGNGGEGLLTRMALLEREVDQLRELKELKAVVEAKLERAKWNTYGSAVAFLAALAAIIMQFIQ